MTYTKEYKTKFIQQMYDACNTFHKFRIQNSELKINDEKKNRFKKYILMWKEKVQYSKSLKEALKKNETANHRVIGLTIETRPEYVTDTNCQFRRELGVTRIEMGLQSLDEKVLVMNKRGHTVQQAREACHKLRQYGFKFSLHIMPGLYGSDYSKDLKSFQDLYTDPFFKPDEIKFYPTSVIPNTELCRLYEQGKYKPLETKDIEKLIRQTFLDVIPPYTRIKRLIRDIPTNEIVAWSTVTNLSQLMHTKIKWEIQNSESRMKKFYKRLYGDYSLYKTIKTCLQVIARETKQLNIDKISTLSVRNDTGDIKTFIIGKQPDLKSFRNFVSLDTRSREIRHQEQWTRNKDQINIIIRKYLSSWGVEYFISFEDQLGYIYGFTRLLLPTENNAINIPWLGKSTAIIRELHVYGNVETIKRWNDKTKKSVQHTGFWRQLMEIAEQISGLYNYKKLSVISGIWVRAYYRKLGYKLEWTYMIKKLK